MPTCDIKMLAFLICNRGKVLEGVVMTTPRVTQRKLKSSLISKICSGTANNDDVQQKKDLAQDDELNDNGGENGPVHSDTPDA